MAKKKIGIYTDLVSTFNNKVEDLYLIVDKESIVFSVKNKISNDFVAFEHFVNTPDNIGWHQLIAYLQNNSKLIQAVFENIYFVWNSPRFVMTKIMNIQDTLLYQQELDLVHGSSSEQELYLHSIGDDKMIVFSVPDALSTLLSRSFPTGKWHHYIEYSLDTVNEKAVFLYLFENNYYLRLVKDGKNQLLNYYPTEGDDQNCYTILNACNNIFEQTNTIDIKIIGVNSLQDSFINSLVPYFKTFELISFNNGVVQNTLNKNYPNHIYATYFIF
jgi:hypothetical protein